MDKYEDKTDWARVDALTDDDIAQAVANDPDAAPLNVNEKPLKIDMLPPDVQSALNKVRSKPRKAATKKQVTIRLSPEVLDAFRREGKGWQTRINTVLQEWVHQH